MGPSARWRATRPLPWESRPTPRVRRERGGHLHRPRRLRRALGATRRHISAQLLTESAVLAALGGIAGLGLGASATWAYAHAKAQPFVIPAWTLIAAPAAGLVIGALAGSYPAAKAARLSPTKALRA